MSRALQRIQIDEKSLKSLEKELGERVSKVLDEVSAKCDKLIKQAEKDCDAILNTYGAKSIIQHNVNYKLLEKRRKP